MNNRKYCHGCLFNKENCEFHEDRQLTVKSVFMNERSNYKTRITTYGCYKRNLKSSFPTENIVRDNLSKCRSCGQDIKWERTNLGKWTPKNLDGITHWSTCPDVKNFRREK